MSAPEYLRCIKSGAKGVPSPACIFVEIARDLERYGNAQSIPDALIANYALATYNLLMFQHTLSDSIASYTGEAEVLMKAALLAWKPIDVIMQRNNVPSNTNLLDRLTTMHERKSESDDWDSLPFDDEDDDDEWELF